MLRPPSLLAARPSINALHPRITRLRIPPSIHQQTRNLSIYQPRKVRQMKTHGGVIPCRTGLSTKGTTLEFGQYGLRLARWGRELSAKQLQGADAILRRHIKEIKGAKIIYRFACNRPICRKGGETRMGKGKGGFHHWGLLAPAGKMLFEIRSPDMRLEIAREALNAAGRILPGPVQFVQRKDSPTPAIIGTKPAPKYHAGRLDDGRVDAKIRAKVQPDVIPAINIGEKKKRQLRRGMVRG